MTFVAESLPMDDSDWRYFCEEAQAEIRSDLEAILDRMERGTTTKADAILVAGYLGLGSRYETEGPICKQEDDPE